jgi:glycosyltransferase involved in cell wall biosynthesis
MTMDRHKLSVALCTYNGAKYLPAQLESIVSQTRRPDELIIGDDCSTDATVEILRKFAARAPFPVYLHLNDHNIGSIKNFEHTILHCHGDIIALSDQDDVWLEPKLARLEARLREEPDVGLVFSDAELVNEELRPLGRRLWEISFRPDERDKFLQGQWLDVLLIRNVVTGATMAFRSRFCSLVFPMPTLAATVHDAWIALAIGAFAILAPIDETLLLYRQHSRQQLGIDVHPKRGHMSAIGREGYSLSKLYYALEIKRLNDTRAAFIELGNRVATCSQGFEQGNMLQKTLQEKIGIMEDMIAHYHVRGELSSNRPRRIVPVAQELFARRYNRYSRGVLSALKDLLR